MISTLETRFCANCHANFGDLRPNGSLCDSCKPAFCAYCDNEVERKGDVCEQCCTCPIGEFHLGFLERHGKLDALMAARDAYALKQESGRAA